jgi:hypothetical protein
VLDQVAAERCQHQHQQRDRDNGDDLEADLADDIDEAAAIDADRGRMRDQAAQRGGDAGRHRAGERHQQQRAAGDHEPGIDLLTRDHVATLVRLVEPLLCRVF